MKIREYSGPLTVLAAGVLGFSLICLVSAAALANPRTPHASDIGAKDIVDSAFSNPIGTAVALTAVEISEYIPTPTSTFTKLATLSPTLALSPTSTARKFLTWTPVPPTRTRGSGSTATQPPTLTPTLTVTRTPTRTLTPSPTNSPIPTNTFTPQPTETDTPLPPTNTLVPTNTPNPTETDTPRPPSTPTVEDTPTAQLPIPESTNQNIPQPG